MRYTIPDYYREFHCTASQCPDTCCAGWKIMIDETSLKKYRMVKGAVGNRLRNGICWKDASFRQYQHRCEFLNEENLCDLYSDLGPGMLCRTCRTYPRHIEEFQGLREISLSLSCPEAARIILKHAGPVRFLSADRDRRETEDEDFDYLLFSQLMDTRDTAIAILQNRELPFSVRMSMALALAHDLQGRILRGDLFSGEELRMRYQKESAPRWFQKRLKGKTGQTEKRYLFMKEMFGAFSQLEVLRKEWPQYLNRMEDALYVRSPESYAHMRGKFLEEAVLDKESGMLWECHWEQLAVYFIFTYFPGAVYDQNAFAKMKLAAVSVLWIQEMVLAEWISRGETVSFSQLHSISYRYSREIEHSDDNLNQLEQILTEDKRFSFEKLLWCIVN